MQQTWDGDLWVGMGGRSGSTYTKCDFPVQMSQVPRGAAMPTCGAGTARSCS